LSGWSSRPLDAFAVLAPVALFTLAVLINRVTSGASADLTLLGKADYLPYLGPVGALLLWFLTQGLGEETGWRGYACILGNCHLGFHFY